MLGEAFLRIHEPEKAVKAFEDALKLSPKDLDLAVKVGKGERGMGLQFLHQFVG